MYLYYYLFLEPSFKIFLPQTLFHFWSQYCVWTEGPFTICIKTLRKKNGPINQWNWMNSLFCKSSTELSDGENESERDLLTSVYFSWLGFFPRVSSAVKCGVFPEHHCVFVNPWSVYEPPPGFLNPALLVLSLISAWSIMTHLGAVGLWTCRVCTRWK